MKHKFNIKEEITGSFSNGRQFSGVIVELEEDESRAAYIVDDGLGTFLIYESEIKTVDGVPV